MKSIIEKISSIDPEIADAIANEHQRQEDHLELIASENIASRAVMAAQGSILTNKYAEGYPEKRYYGGCEWVDVAEKLAVERAKNLFRAEYVNVQPHSGSQANMAAYFALLETGDTVLGMNLSHGGHLTHGSPASFSGKIYNFVHYGVNRDTGMIDYDAVADLAKKHNPKLIVAGASAYPRTIDFQAFADIAKSVNAYFMVDMAHIAGLVAAGVHPSPVGLADVVTSTTHKTLRGPRGGIILTNGEHQKKIGSVVFPGMQGGPLMHVIAAKAVAFREASGDAFIQYQTQVIKNARALAESLMAGGWSLVSNGTDNHMLLADLTKLDITGKDAEAVLGRAGITVNKNSVPFETRSPFVTSGIRIGTPFLTSRGMQEEQMDKIGKMIIRVIEKPQDISVTETVRQEVKALCASFPLYQE